jgi:hypothetical protein
MTSKNEFSTSDEVFSEVVYSLNLKVVRKLIVLVKTPDVTNWEVRQSALEYVKEGYQIVCLIYPEKRIAEVYSSDGNFEYLVDGDILDGGDVLPGFTLPVATLFP